jgi:hypothetical protein
MTTHGKVHPIASTQPEEAGKVLLRSVKDLQDTYRTELLNRLYYGYRLARVKRWNLVLEIVVAIGTSSAIGAWVVWQKTETGEIVWAILAGAAALVAILKPILQLPKKVEQYSKLFVEHGNLFYQLDILEKEITKHQGFTSETERSYRTVLEKARGLAIDDEPSPSKRLIDKCCQEVNQKIPKKTLWRPKVLEGSSHGQKRKPARV